LHPLRSLQILSPIVAAACTQAPAHGARATTSEVAFRNVTVIPMDSPRVLKDYTVVVRNRVIQALGPTSGVPVPPGAQLIDGTGRYLMPGLIDAHVHLRHQSELLSYLVYGVTSVVHLSGPTSGVPDPLGLRAQVARGEVLGPTIYASGRIVDGDPPIFPGVSIAVTSPADAAAAVEAQIASGVDFIKLYNNLTTPEMQSAIAAAHARGVVVFGHIPRHDGRVGALEHALTAGLDVVAHGEEYFFTFFYGDTDRRLSEGLLPAPDERQIPSAVQLTLSAGAAVTPNLSFVVMTRAQLDSLPRVLSDPEASFLSPTVLTTWKTQNPTTRRDLALFDRRERVKLPFVEHLTLALSQAGVPLLLGTDASAPGMFPGKSAHVELRALVRAGLTPYQALAAGTRVPGAFLQAHTQTQPLGTVTLGSRGDLILLHANPLDDVTVTDSIVGVLVAGRWLPIDSLKAMRRAAAALPR